MEGRALQTTLSKFSAACRRRFVWKETRSLLILVLAFFTFRMTLGYLIFPPARMGGSSAVTILESYLPIQVYGFLWLIVTVFLLSAAFIRGDAIALGLASGMNTLWFISYAWDFFAALGTSRAWLSALLYLGLVFLTLVTSRVKNPFAVEVAEGGVSSGDRP